MNTTTKISIFHGKKIRKTIHNNEWWFVIVDIVAALTDSVQPEGYIKDMRRRDPLLSEGWGQIATPLSVQTEGGLQKINCANTEGIFRIIQSIPSPKAEPFKLWLEDAKDGGKVAGRTRKDIEKRSGKKVATRKNFLAISQNKRLSGKN